MKLNSFKIRDPFIYVDPISHKYNLYGSNGVNEFYVYVSSDLKEWVGPFTVFKPPKSFWGKKDFWAPEVYFYNGGYYMFATFSSNKTHRMCTILHSESLLGPFEEYSEPITPKTWESLDGTLYTDNLGKPYCIFVHEWTQIGNGEVCIVELSSDLKKAISKPITLFKATDAPWAKNPKWNKLKKEIFVVDGPFVINVEKKNYLLWSTFNEKGYCICLSSPNKLIENPDYKHITYFPLVECGHSMVFKDLEGNMKIIYHNHNCQNGFERAEIRTLTLHNGEFILK